MWAEQNMITCLNHYVKWPKLHLVRDFRVLCLLSLCITDPDMPEYLKSRFHTLAVTHGRNTCSGNNLTLSIPLFMRNAYSYSFTVNAATMWNGHPSAIRSANSVMHLKGLIQRDISLLINYCCKLYILIACCFSLHSMKPP
jgi:hypothetical protein